MIPYDQRGKAEVLAAFPVHGLKSLNACSRDMISPLRLESVLLAILVATTDGHCILEINQYQGNNRVSTQILCLPMHTINTVYTSAGTFVRIYKPVPRFTVAVCK